MTWRDLGIVYTASVDQTDIAELVALEAEICRRSLHDYVRSMWPVFEPATEFVDSWHLGAICDHEQAVFTGQIKKLLINVCPRSGKSICTSVALPTWGWTRAPETRFLFSSYSSDLSLEFATTARRVIESSWFQTRWNVQLSGDQNNNGFYANPASGYRMATSVGGSATGKGGDLLVVDDVHNLKTIHSDIIRTEDVRWFFKVWSSRINNKKNDRQIVIMQRGHEDDLTRALLEQGDWTVLKLPTEYEPREWTSPIGWSDPRTVAGELLNPARIGPEENKTIKAELGPIDYSCQHSQEPMPEKGGMFERAWFEIVDHAPTDVVMRVRFWDAAGSETERSPYTAGVLMSQTRSGNFFVEDIQRDRLVSAKVDALMLQTAALDGVATDIAEEQEPGSAGKAVIAAHRSLLTGYTYTGITATGDKFTRWKPLASQARPVSEDEPFGRVKLVAGGWNKDFLDEVVANKRAKYKDQLDAAAGALYQLRTAPRELRVAAALWG